MNLISTANVISKRWKYEKIEVSGARRAYDCFLDLTRSQEWLKTQSGELIVEALRRDTSRVTTGWIQQLQPSFYKSYANKQSKVYK